MDVTTLPVSTFTHALGQHIPIGIYSTVVPVCSGACAEGECCGACVCEVCSGACVWEVCSRACVWEVYDACLVGSVWLKYMESVSDWRFMLQHLVIQHNYDNVHTLRSRTPHTFSIVTDRSSNLFFCT